MKRLQIKHILIAFLVILPILLLARIYSLLRLIDPLTGFFHRDSATLGAWIVVATLIITIIFIIFGRAKPLETATRTKKSILVAVASILMALTSIAELARLWLSPIYGQSFYNRGVLNWLLIAVFALLVITAVFFTIQAIAFLNTKYKMPRILPLAPLVLFNIKILIDFTIYSSIANIENSIYSLIYLAVMALFWLMHARLTSNVDQNRAQKWILPLGLAAIILGLLTALPIIAVVLFRGAHRVWSEHISPLAITSSLYIAVYLWHLIFVKKDDRGAENLIENEEISEKDYDDEPITEEEKSDELDRINSLIEDIESEKTQDD